tara:strand:- start:1209 stop:2252 length:1044 start_codon:yes stop_codon:yes gene_type:complete
MKKLIIKSLFILPFVLLSQNPNPDSNINDGPYIFLENNRLIEKNIENGKVITNNLNLDNFDTIFKPDKSYFSKVRKIVALSDIHGQYDLAIELLRNNNVIDDKLNWDFGKGHLVIVGDIFDRGDQINEVLWFVYNLEIQAKKKGGRVHYLMGNHEYMVLQNDLRYINKKYKVTSKLLNIEYDKLYGNNTILGRWLRSKSTIIKINDNIFVHGGISQDFILQNGVDLDDLNKLMRINIDTPKQELMSSDLYELYYGGKSLTWYRGYFKNYFRLYNEYLTENDISKLLNQLNSDHIIVGHCSFDNIVQFYNGKIYGVDSSIKKGKNGEVLLIKNKRFYRGNKKGNLMRL